MSDITVPSAAATNVYRTLLSDVGGEVALDATRSPKFDRWGALTRPVGLLKNSALLFSAVLTRNTSGYR